MLEMPPTQELTPEQLMTDYSELIDPEFAAFLTSQGFVYLRKFGGVVYGVNQFCFTFGLCTHVTWSTPHKDRWCFKEAKDAALSLAIWNGLDDPPGPWLKQKYMRERHNPLLYTHKGGTWYERNDTPEDVTWKDRGNLIRCT